MAKKRTIRTIINIFLVLLILAAGFGIYKYYVIISEKQKVEDAKIFELAQKANEENAEQLQQNYDNLQAEYEKDLETVEEYMPGIVCWGDVITGGSAGGISFPRVLDETIQERITSRYDFRSTIENSYDYTRIDWNSYKIDIPVVNMGTGEESSYTVLGRAGAMPYMLDENIVIPAECEQITVKLKSENGNTVKPVLAGDGGVNPVTINGVEGTIVADPSSYNKYSSGRYYFTRTVPGVEVTAEKGTPVITAATDKYRDYIHVIFVGTYGYFRNAQDLVNQQKMLLARQTKNTDRYIVIGMYANGTDWLNSSYDDLESHMAQEYGDRFINLRKYLLSDAVSDGKFSTNKDDDEALKKGRIPACVLSKANKIELNATVYELLGKIVYDRMDYLGYFDEIKTECGIPKWRNDGDNSQTSMYGVYY